MRVDIWVVVVIMGDARSVIIKKRIKDRNLGDTRTLWGKGRKRSSPKKCGTDKIAKKSAD